MSNKNGTTHPAEPRPVWHTRRYQIAVGVCGAALAVGAVVVHQHNGFSALGHVFGLGGDGAGPGVTPGAQGPAPLSAGLGRGGAPAASSPGAPRQPGAPASQGRPGTPGKPGRPGRPGQPGAPVESPTTRSVVINGISATQVDSGSMPSLHHTMRVVSARGNLWGMRELAWIADAGQNVGDARCSANFRIGNTAPRVRPTLLICWRTSATKSVYTVAVDIDHRPSSQASVAVLDQAWARLG